MVARPRGFTLVELMIAGAVGAVVMLAASAYLLHLAALQRHQLEIAHLRRAGESVAEQLAAELRQAGLGAPTRGRLGSGAPFAPALLHGSADQIGFLSDLPRPDASLNGLSRLASDQALAFPGVAILNELNGDCDLDEAASPHCSTASASTLFAGAAACGSATTGASTCPWALGKYRPGEPVLIVDGSGRWEERIIAASLSASGADRMGLALTASLPSGLLLSPNTGFVSTLDRVFYRLTGTTLERAQCWGSVGSASLADLGSSASGPPAACVSGTDGTGWEALASGVQGFALEYRDASGTPLAMPLSEASLRRVRSVAVSLALEATHDGQPIEQTTSFEVALRQ